LLLPAKEGTFDREDGRLLLLLKATLSSNTSEEHQVDGVTRGALEDTLDIWFSEKLDIFLTRPCWILI
jgi:hypothetical protein